MFCELSGPVSAKVSAVATSITEGGRSRTILQTRCGVHLQPPAVVAAERFLFVLAVQLVSFVEVLAEQQVVVMSGQMPDQFLQRLEHQRAEAARVPSTRFRRVDYVPMDRTQMLQQMRLLLEHGHT